MKNFLTILIFIAISIAAFPQKKVSLGINAGAAIPMAYLEMRQVQIVGLENMQNSSIII